MTDPVDNTAPFRGITISKTTIGSQIGNIKIRVVDDTNTKSPSFPMGIRPPGYGGGCFSKSYLCLSKLFKGNSEQLEMRLPTKTSASLPDGSKLIKKAMLCDDDANPNYLIMEVFEKNKEKYLVATQLSAYWGHEQSTQIIFSSHSDKVAFQSLEKFMNAIKLDIDAIDALIPRSLNLNDRNANKSFRETIERHLKDFLEIIQKKQSR